ncbi:geranylgeranyl reductase family protein [Flexivirga caeni]|uniref:Geranylgeranyl reductase family protein n=1 Tax=Flexivirga caeni TaxID=2294115 RepID=A0A3M9M3V0_9MICO|nr:geranylgeranyl reductase family protein [Flexivirga caeni]RNI19877.1 geranylgeranyl reductase family protein [Flexivirga caeni]
MTQPPEPYDVIVVGAGPAGSCAAHAAATAGARTLVIDRARFPRYKTCGGGLIGPTLASLPPELPVPVQQEITRASFSLAGRKPFERRGDGRILTLVNRADLDTALLRAAQAAGAHVRTAVTFSAVDQDDDLVTVRTSDGDLHSRVVVGADGSASRIGRYVGVQLRQTDLGLEAELAPDDTARAAWAGRVHLDWGPVPGSYAWVFPKDDVLTVGVIMAKGRPAETKRYLTDFIAQQRLSRLDVVRESGHLTRCRAAGSPLGRGRVLVAGDAAGLLEPWTREGISYAVRSGRMAGATAARIAAGELPPGDGLTAYGRQVAGELGTEMLAGERTLRAFERHPAAFHAMLRTRPGWRVFTGITRGSTTLALVERHASVRWGLAAMNRW